MYDREDSETLNRLATERVMVHFCAPASVAPSETEDKLLVAALQQELPFEGQTLQVYVWGEGRTIILVHGWGSRASHLAFLARALAKAGFRVVAFDGPGHGKSEFNSSNPRSNLPEFCRAIFHVANRYGPIYGLIGHSFGGTAAVFAACGQANLAGYRVEVEKLGMISAPSGIRSIVRHYCRNHGLPDGAEAAVIEQLEYEFPLKVQDYEIGNALGSFDGEVLAIHDSDDQEMDIEDARAMVAGHDHVDFIETSGEGHRRILVSRTLVKEVKRFLSDT